MKILLKCEWSLFQLHSKTNVIDKVAPAKNKRVKGNSQEWFNSEVSKRLVIREKLFKKFKSSKFMWQRDI